LFGFVCLAVLLCQTATSTAYAQLNPDRQVGGNQYTITHAAPRPAELPLPGQPLLLKVQLKNWEDTTRLLRTMIVQDGQLIYTASDAGYMNEYETPTYDIEIASPRASLEYQFFFEDEEGQVVKSDRYVVTRKCLIDTSLKDIDYQSEPQLNEQIPLLVRQADKLEKELISYETTLQLLGDLTRGLTE
jgi:hypothetical protein